MIAVDSNVILRLVLDDDDTQVAAARVLMLRAPLFVSLSVLLETGWVLQSRYRFPRPQVADALRLVVNLNGVVVARLPIVLWAIGRYREGADLADLVHLASAAKIGAFATFDRGVAAKSGTGDPIEIETLT